ncbi:TPA: hypothetical protein N0F65_001272 [Lagenidium giganteum]|uniref:EF-hand domain-containing protein n=1 Tax=Lagenidium giganteum TaxID=4803 RepID=A0AAV2YUW2_9STRA|nr:TPA: hypothetical protein N0F65_001272 [Lagenidium giganteum]
MPRGRWSRQLGSQSTMQMLRVLKMRGGAGRAMAMASIAGATAMWNDRYQRPAQLEEAPSFSERMVGNYENRIRRFSSPERVFEYFSSVELDKQYYMTREDLARAVTPYTHRSGVPLSSKNVKYNAKALALKPSPQVVNQYAAAVRELFLEKVNVTERDVQMLLKFREDHRIDFETHVKVLRSLQITNAEYDQFVELHGGPKRESSFFDLVDADGDGLISYAEYMFFNTLLSIPERQFELAFKMFDTDGNGKLDHREFKQIMDLMRLRTPAGRQDRSLKEDDAPIFKHLFGELSTESLSYEEFCQFRRDLKREIMKIQISFVSVLIVVFLMQYDLDGNKDLSPWEFGMFLVSHVNQTEIDKWVQRVETLRDMPGSISEEEFLNFNAFLDHLDEMKVAIELILQEHGLNKEQFQRATCAALRGQKKQTVTPLQIDILFALFDTDGDGHLSPKEFIEVMQKRKDGGFNEVMRKHSFVVVNAPFFDDAIAPSRATPERLSSSNA